MTLMIKFGLSAIASRFGEKGWLGLNRRASVRPMQRIYFIIALATGPLASAVDFERDIYPIFEEHCIECHGPDKQKSEFRIDQRSRLLRGGDSGIPGIVPGNPVESFLIEVLKDPDPEFRMPSEADPLSSDQIELMEAWITEGAEWPGQMDVVVEEVSSDHWSFQPVNRAESPVTAEQAIDAFLLEKLGEAGLSPNPAADVRSLIRRVSIVLTGLPSVPERVRAFQEAYATNPSAAYSDLVDELLASSHFGERWGQHWLDVIRWAETNGSESNLYRKNAWVYRDYVVRAFNEDKPYDRFIREQIAGDSMDAGEATGFLVSGSHVPPQSVGREETAIRQARADRMDEIVQTVGASMIGMTMSCARCHNHKFDPITISDYYSMTGIFQDIEFGGRRPEYSEDHPKRQKAAPLWKAIAEQRKILKSLGNWEEDWGGYRELYFDSVKTRKIRISFQTPNAKIDELEIFGNNERQKNLALASNGATVDGPSEMFGDVRTNFAYANDGEYGAFGLQLKSPKKSDEKPWVVVSFDGPQEINRLRLSSNREYYYEVDYQSVEFPMGFSNYCLEVENEAGDWVEVASISKINTANKNQPKRAAAIAKIATVAEGLAEVGPQVSFVGRFVEPVVTRVLSRGSPESPRNEVVPAAPMILAGDLGLSSDSSGSERRAQFADWVASSENPLTARVMVNRVWHHIFGMGIVPTTSDFGKAGALPSHPELLDWLAAEFVEPSTSSGEPWSVKALIRLIVMSDAFRQSSQPNDAGLAADAGSSLLWRFPPRRVEAEVIRDAVLLASGSLDDSIGGRGYRIYNNKKTYSQWEVVNNYGPETWRRMIYQERMRRVDDKMFMAFDFPDCGQVRAKRPISTTPLQALNLLNSKFVQEQADRLAERSIKDSADDDLEAQIRRSFQLIFNRDPDDEELAASIEVVKESDLSLVCRSLINSNEFAFLP
ncbi:MAG: PSD1 and planctomycete cytochrome C domain-containing protein [Opitutales bacterium]